MPSDLFNCSLGVILQTVIVTLSFRRASSQAEAEMMKLKRLAYKPTEGSTKTAEAPQCFISSSKIETPSYLPQAPPFLRIFFQDKVSTSCVLSYRSLHTLRLISVWITLHGFTQSKIWCQRMFNELQRGNHQHRSKFKFHTNASQCFMGRTAANQPTFYSYLFLICIWIFFYATSTSICF